jgi:hypothetical protein
MKSSSFGTFTLRVEPLQGKVHAPEPLLNQTQMAIVK